MSNNIIITRIDAFGSLFAVWCRRRKNSNRVSAVCVYLQTATYSSTKSHFLVCSSVPHRVNRQKQTCNKYQSVSVKHRSQSLKAKDDNDDDDARLIRMKSWQRFEASASLLKWHSHRYLWRLAFGFFITQQWNGSRATSRTCIDVIQNGLCVDWNLFQKIFSPLRLRFYYDKCMTSRGSKKKCSPSNGTEWNMRKYHHFSPSENE